MVVFQTGQPYYKLSDFQHVIRNLPLDELIIAYESATARIVKLRNCSEDEARQYICGAVLALGKGNFSETIGVGRLPADVYGIVLDKIPLYVKLTAKPKGKVATSNHYIMSCHPTEFALRTITGVVPQHEW